MNASRAWEQKQAGGQAKVLCCLVSFMKPGLESDTRPRLLVYISRSQREENPVSGEPE